MATAYQTRTCFAQVRRQPDIRMAVGGLWGEERENDVVESTAVVVVVVMIAKK